MHRRREIKVQDGWLFEALRDRRRVVVGLVKGGRIEGFIKRFDRFCISVEIVACPELLLYKKNIATITLQDPWSRARL